MEKTKNDYKAGKDCVKCGNFTPNLRLVNAGSKGVVCQNCYLNITDNNELNLKDR